MNEEVNEDDSNQSSDAVEQPTILAPAASVADDFTWASPAAVESSVSDESDLLGAQTKHVTQY